MKYGIIGDLCCLVNLTLPYHPGGAVSVVVERSVQEGGEALSLLLLLLPHQVVGSEETGELLSGSVHATKRSLKVNSLAQLCKMLSKLSFMILTF